MRIDDSEIVSDVFDEFKQSKDYEIVLSQKVLGVNESIVLSKVYEPGTKMYDLGIYSVELETDTESLFLKNVKDIRFLKLYCDAKFLYVDTYNEDEIDVKDYSIIIKTNNSSDLGSEKIQHFLSNVKYETEVSLLSHSKKMSESLNDCYINFEEYNFLYKFGFRNMSVSNLSIYCGDIGIGLYRVREIMENKKGLFNLDSSDNIIIKLGLYGVENERIIPMLHSLYNILEESEILRNQKPLFSLSVVPYDFDDVMEVKKLFSKYFLDIFY